MLRTVLRIGCIYTIMQFNNSLSAQEQKYIVKIVDENSKKPIAGATISVNKKPINRSNLEGIFSFNWKNNPHVTLTHINYCDTSITLQQDFQVIFLTPKTTSLSEVVVRRNNINDVDIRNLAGSVVTVDITKLSERSELDMGRLFEGQVPGLTISYSGELGTKPQIRLRGNSSLLYKGNANAPLFVMDGVVISTETFLTLSPNDFQTIKVLKDAPATALYGIKAANGVIELTSKKGFSGKPLVSFYMKQGITLRGERSVLMMGTDEKLRFEEKMERSDLPGYLYSERYIRKLYEGASDLHEKIRMGQRILDSLRSFETDWFKELIKMNHFQSHVINIRGGNNHSNYFYSANYSSQGGRIPGNSIEQLTARANFDYPLSDILNLSFNNSIGIATSKTENGMNNDPTALAFSLNPYETKQSESLTSYPGRSYQDLIKQYRKRNTSKRLNSTLIGHWDILKGISLSGVIGIDYSLAELYQRIYSTAYSQREAPINAMGYLNESDSKDLGFTSNFRLNYQRQFAKHDLYWGINTDYYQANVNTIGAAGFGIPDELESLSGINQGLTKSYAPTISGIKSQNKQLGFGAALGYSYDNTYDFYASLKRDGSSLLPNNARWNDAWSAGIGWNPSSYSFLNKQDIISHLKVKASVGYTASMVGITAKDIRTTFNNSSHSFYGQNRLLELMALPNRNLRPQQTYSTNLSIDVGLDKRVNLLLTWYNNMTKQAIVNTPVASSNGFKTYAQNIGELQNSGLETTISGDLLRFGVFSWNSSISLSYNRNLVKKLYGTDRLFLTDESFIPEYEVGKPLGVMYGLISNGIHPLKGIPEYLQPDGNVIDLKAPLRASYFQHLGYAIAPYHGFFNNYISFKNWSLNINFNYGFGGINRYSNSYVRESRDAHFNAIKGQLDNMWFDVGDENKIYPAKNLPTILYDLLKNYANTTTIYKSDYIKLNYVQLSYNWFPNEKTIKYVKSARFSVQADNISTYRRQKDIGGLNVVHQPVVTLSLYLKF
ncbi:SusC/RagA family TonB-linked outer membrane protein [Sphingobacterium humi]|uniref:SusC/RagA family TonB-linked outer membrane protein n=2 Tax=Sphingobacterium humi TaxID=1796905 RepID=A0A6N8L072_9SPHI|nr:SusC/RagA family TonB-linked outer membrane protein [Sphingobacterium humi]